MDLTKVIRATILLYQENLTTSFLPDYKLREVAQKCGIDESICRKIKEELMQPK